MNNNIKRNKKLLEIFTFYIFIILNIILNNFSISPSWAKDISRRNTIYVGYNQKSFSTLNLQETRVAMDVLMNKIDEDFHFKTVIYDNFESLIEAVKEKKVDLLNILTSDYFKIENKDIADPAFVAIQSEEDLVEVFIILTRKDSGINSLKDLKGKSITIQIAGRETIPLVWLDTILLRQDYDTSDNFFEMIKKEDKASKAVLPVFFKEVDACIVIKHAYSSMTDLNPQLEQEMQIIEKSEPLTCYLPCFRKDLPREIKEKLVNNTYDLKNYPEGIQILEMMGIQRVIPFDPKFLISIRNLFEEYEKLRIKKMTNLE